MFSERESKLAVIVDGPERIPESERSTKRVWKCFCFHLGVLSFSAPTGQSGAGKCKGCNLYQNVVVFFLSSFAIQRERLGK